MSKEKDSYIKELEMETFDLIAKCIELINVVGWDDDDCYTFEDGETWEKFDPDNGLDLIDGIEDEIAYDLGDLG